MPPYILPFKDNLPQIDPSCLLTEGSCIIGDVIIKKNTSVWYNTVIRGDVNYVRIGEDTNIQDGSVIHVTYKGNPTLIGNGVTIGHKALLHACCIEDYALIGMGAIVLDGCTVGAESLVGAGSLLTQNTIYPPRSLIIGSPAKVKRELTPEEIAFLHQSAKHYVTLAQEYRLSVPTS